MITVVARPRIPARNTVELTLEKIRAGILPVPADNVLDRIIEHARLRGVDVQWQRRDGYPVVVMRYTPSLSREDVQLEEVEIRSGQIRLAGRSDRTRGAFFLPRLPSRSFLQIHFPETKTPRGARRAIGPGTRQVNLADKLISRKPDPDMARAPTPVSECPLGHPLHASPIAGHRPLVAQISQPVVGEGPRRICSDRAPAVHSWTRCASHPRLRA